MHILLDALESLQAGYNVTRNVKDKLGMISTMGETMVSADSIKRLCGNLPDLWINDIIKNNNIGGFK